MSDEIKPLEDDFFKKVSRMSVDLPKQTIILGFNSEVSGLDEKCPALKQFILDKFGVRDPNPIVEVKVNGNKSLIISLPDADVDELHMLRGTIKYLM